MVISNSSLSWHKYGLCQQFDHQHFVCYDAGLTNTSKLIFIPSVRQEPAGCLNQAVRFEHPWPKKRKRGSNTHKVFQHCQGNITRQPIPVYTSSTLAASHSNTQEVMSAEPVRAQGFRGGHWDWTLAGPLWLFLLYIHVTALSAPSEWSFCFGWLWCFTMQSTTLSQFIEWLLFKRLNELCFIEITKEGNNVK